MTPQLSGRQEDNSVAVADAEKMSKKIKEAV